MRASFVVDTLALTVVSTTTGGTEAAEIFPFDLPMALHLSLVSSRRW